MITEVQASSILSKISNGPDPWFGISYSMNVYRGCQHACIYCDSRSDCYQLGDLSHIRVKTNAPILLQKKLKGMKSKAVIGTGSMNDPYMPVEKEYGLVRSCLKIIAQYGFPVHIITKSYLVLRDMDVIADIARIHAVVSFTITCAEDTMSSLIEPGAPPSSQRLKAMKQLAENGIQCGVLLMPILPFVNDTPENISHLIELSAKHGASYIMPWFGLTQRQGQREYLHSKLAEFDKTLPSKYDATFGDTYSCNSENSKMLWSICNEKAQSLGLSLKPHLYQSGNQAEQLRLW